MNISYTVDELGKALFEEAGDALFLFEPNTDELLDVNPTAERLTHLARAELLRMPATYWFRFGGAGKGNVERLRQAATKSGVFHGQDGFFLRTGQDGVWVPVSLTVARLHVQPRTLALITARDVREHRQMVAQLQRAEKELRRVLAAIPDCVWSAEVEGGHWRYHFFSPVVTRLTGQMPEAFLGGPQAWADQVHPDDRTWWRHFHDRLRSGRPGQADYRVVRADGGVRWVRESVQVSREDGGPLRLDGVVTDITETRYASEQHDRLFELSLDLLCIAGFDGYFKRLNPAWERTLGWTAEELLSRPYAEFVHPDDLGPTASEARKLNEGGHTVSFENRYRCRDGSYKWLMWNAAPYPSGQLIYAAARDISDRKRAEQELEQKAAELARAYEQARQLAADLDALVASERAAHRALKQAQSQLVQAEKMAGLGQMVAGIAHEINNPLAFVGNNLMVLHRDVEVLRHLLGLYQGAEAQLADRHAQAFAAARDYAEQIDAPYTLSNLEGLLHRSEDGLRRIRQIVLDLRDFARLDDQQVQEADLNAGIESTVNIVRGRANARDVGLTLDLRPLPRVLCFPAKINQVVLNLVANAIDACGRGGRVTVRSRAVAGGVEIEVEDDGHGIPPAILDKIFDPFFTTKPPGQGTGLGLSISHGIVADHGGRIEVHSEPGRGARFVVHLPVRLTPP